VTQLGEGRGAGQDAGGAALGAPGDGEILAERYQLAHHINTDSAGRQIWHGIDVLLRRPVAVLIRYPGGPAAAQMIRTAIEASRIVHPNLVGVYDAIDEQSRAYVVREWVDGASLRDHIAAGPFDAERALAVAHAVAAAVTAVHATGMTHGNIHPGTALIGLDGRVMLADARADGAAPGEEDVRAVGGLLYYALTGYWPHAEVAGPASLPDAMRDGAGWLVAPRQVRAGVPDQLDNLTMDLLDRRLPVPPAEVLAGEFARLSGPPDQMYYAEPEFDAGAGRLRFSAADQPTKPSGRKIAFGLGGLLVAGVVGMLLGLNWLTGDPDPDSVPAGSGGATPTATAPGDAGQPTPLTLGPDQVRVVDPPNGNRDELEGVELVVDGDPGTGWRTDEYVSPDFGGIKPGMGILIDLGEPTRVASVRVELAAAGATAELRAGDADPGNTGAGDDQIHQSFVPVGEPKQDATTMVFNVPDDEAHQYLMVWFSQLPPDGDGYRIEVQQVVVEGY
jgi:hypothetical protein